MHTFIVPLLWGYLEYSQYEARWVEQRAGRDSVCILRREVSYDKVVWC